MCIAILNTKGTTLKKEILRNCWENNGDGAGMLYINNQNKLEVFKEMRSFESFYEKYREVKSNYGRRNIVLHFRISTHGRVNETNCHPFLVDDNIGFVHNGMIYDVPISTEYSDTYMFNESILKGLRKGFEYNETILDMLEHFIGIGSKLIFLNDNNEFFIVNESAGHWHLGCWFSNTSYQQVNSWFDFGGIRKEKKSFSYSPSLKQTTGSHYYGAARSFIDEDCSRCGSPLYGEKELEDGICVFCRDEEQASNTNHYQELVDGGICPWCEEEESSVYVADFNEHVCKNCASFFIEETKVSGELGV